MSAMNIFMLIVFVLCEGWAGFATWLLGPDAGYCMVYGTFGSISVLFFLRAYTYFTMNDYQYF